MVKQEVESPLELRAGLLPLKLPWEGWTLPHAEDQESGQVRNGDSIIRFKCEYASSLTGEGEGGCAVAMATICSRGRCPGPAMFPGVQESGCACTLPSALAR